MDFKPGEIVDIKEGIELWNDWLIYFNTHDYYDHKWIKLYSHQLLNYSTTDACFIHAHSNHTIMISDANLLVLLESCYSYLYIN